MEKLSPAEEKELDHLLDTLEPIDVAGATRVLLETKQVMDELGVTFFLRQGTCLGAVRDKAFIPWDDDVDIGSVIGLHGFAEEMVEPVARVFRERGFLTRIERKDHYLYIPLVKPPVRADWCCYWVMDGAVFMYPGIRIPVRLLADLVKVDFLGSEFRVPNPPEEYLELKYGPDWRVPKQAGEYEEDVLDLIPDTPAPGRAGRLRQAVAKSMMPWRTSTVEVRDESDRPVEGAEVSVAGLGTSRSNKHGVVKLYVPREDHYAMVVRFSGHEGVLYVERVTPATRYTYRPGREHLQAVDAEQRSGR